MSSTRIVQAQGEEKKPVSLSSTPSSISSSSSTSHAPSGIKSLETGARALNNLSEIIKKTVLDPSLESSQKENLLIEIQAVFKKIPGLDMGGFTRNMQVLFPLTNTSANALPTKLVGHVASFLSTKEAMMFSGRTCQAFRKARTDLLQKEYKGQHLRYQKFMVEVDKIFDYAKTIDMEDTYGADHPDNKFRLLYLQTSDSLKDKKICGGTNGDLYLLVHKILSHLDELDHEKFALAHIAMEDAHFSFNPLRFGSFGFSDNVFSNSSTSSKAKPKAEEILVYAFSNRIKNNLFCITFNNHPIKNISHLAQILHAYYPTLNAYVEDLGMKECLMGNRFQQIELRMDAKQLFSKLLPVTLNMLPAPERKEHVDVTVKDNRGFLIT